MAEVRINDSRYECDAGLRNTIPSFAEFLAQSGIFAGRSASNSGRVRTEGASASLLPLMALITPTVSRPAGSSSSRMRTVEASVNSINAPSNTRRFLYAKSSSLEGFAEKIFATMTVSPVRPLTTQMRPKKDPYVRHQILLSQCELATSTGTGVKASNIERLHCSNCNTQRTSLWRRGPDGSRLCNVCGLFARIHARSRPEELKVGMFDSRVKKTCTGEPTPTITQPA